MKLSPFMAAFVFAASAACATACATSRPLPAARVGSAEAAVRAAHEAGAQRLPDAALHLRFAEEQVARARQLIADGEHETAQWLLVRAEADAAVAAALAHEAEQKIAADEIARRAREAAAGPLASDEGAAR